MSGSTPSPLLLPTLPFFPASLLSLSYLLSPPLSPTHTPPISTPTSPTTHKRNTNTYKPNSISYLYLATPPYHLPYSYYFTRHTAPLPFTLLDYFPCFQSRIHTPTPPALISSLLATSTHPALLPSSSRTSSPYTSPLTLIFGNHRNRYRTPTATPTLPFLHPPLLPPYTILLPSLLLPLHTHQLHLTALPLSTHTTVTSTLTITLTIPGIF